MTLGLAGLLITIWVVAVAFFRMNRIWLLYYLTGSIGLAFLVIFVGRATPIQGWLETGVAASTFGVANVIGIPARMFEAVDVGDAVTD